MEVHEILRGIVVEVKDAVSGAESHVIPKFIDIHRIGVGDVILAPDGKDGHKQAHRKDKVVEHSPAHDKEPLPRGLRAELPRLGLRFEMLRIHGLVYHACNLAVAAKRQPAHAVFGFPYLEREELEAPCIEEQEKLVYPDSKNPGPEKVSELMENDEHGKGKYYLKYLN